MYLAPRHVKTIGQNFYRLFDRERLARGEPERHFAGVVFAIRNRSSRRRHSLPEGHTAGRTRFPSSGKRGPRLRSLGRWMSASPAEPEVSRYIPPAEDELPSTVVEQANSATGAVRDQALTLYEQGHYAAAADQLASRVSTNPEDAEAMTLLARIHANQGNLAEALAWCDKAIANSENESRRSLPAGHDPSGAGRA